MAIQKSIPEVDSFYGIAFNDAYHRIVHVNVERASDTDPKFKAVIDLAAYATSSATASTRQVDHKRYWADLGDIEAKAGSTFIDKCYAWVMDQDDMAGSTAV